MTPVPKPVAAPQPVKRPTGAPAPKAAGAPQRTPSRVKLPGPTAGGPREQPVLPLKLLGALGRGTDTTLAHVSRGDIVVPGGTRPAIAEALRELFRKEGMNMAEFTVGAAPKTNPVTKLPEFDDSGGEAGGEAGAAGDTGAAGGDPSGNDSANSSEASAEAGAPGAGMGTGAGSTGGVGVEGTGSGGAPGTATTSMTQGMDPNTNEPSPNDPGAVSIGGIQGPPSMSTTPSIMGLSLSETTPADPNEPPETALNVDPLSMALTALGAVLGGIPGVALGMAGRGANNAIGNPAEFSVSLGNLGTTAPADMGSEVGASIGGGPGVEAPGSGEDEKGLGQLMSASGFTPPTSLPAIAKSSVQTAPSLGSQAPLARPGLQQPRLARPSYGAPQPTSRVTPGLVRARGL